MIRGQWLCRLLPAACSLMLLLPQPVAAQSSDAPAFIAAYARQHNFSGSILIHDHHRISYLRSFGLANIPFRVPNTNRTRYWIASITKAFTAVLILQLHDQGRIDLNGTIKAYLPAYPGEGGNTVTIHQLLNHTSGIENFDKVTSAEEAVLKGIPAYQTPSTSDQLLERCCSGPLAGVPGEKFSYNNADYIVLGKIIEQLTGKTFEEVLKEKILGPVGMLETGMMHQSAIVARLADAYFMRDDLKVLVHDLPVYPENWYAAGAMYSTTEDLLKFAIALFGGRLLKRETLALMVKPGLDEYGYGVWAYETTVGNRTYRVVKRPGRIMGAQAQLFHFLDQDVTVIILSNAGTTDLDEFVAEIGKRLVRGER